MAGLQGKRVRLKEGVLKKALAAFKDRPGEGNSGNASFSSSPSLTPLNHAAPLGVIIQGSKDLTAEQQVLGGASSSSPSLPLDGSMTPRLDDAVAVLDGGALSRPSALSPPSDGATGAVRATEGPTAAELEVQAVAVEEAQAGGTAASSVPVPPGDGARGEIKHTEGHLGQGIPVGVVNEVVKDVIVEGAAAHQLTSCPIVPGGGIALAGPQGKRIRLKKGVLQKAFRSFKEIPEGHAGAAALSSTPTPSLPGHAATPGGANAGRKDVMEEVRATGGSPALPLDNPAAIGGAMQETQDIMEVVEVFGGAASNFFPTDNPAVLGGAKDALGGVNLIGERSGSSTPLLQDNGAVLSGAKVSQPSTAFSKLCRQGLPGGQENPLVGSLVKSGQSLLASHSTPEHREDDEPASKIPRLSWLQNCRQSPHSRPRAVESSQALPDFARLKINDRWCSLSPKELMQEVVVEVCQFARRRMLNLAPRPRQDVMATMRSRLHHYFLRADLLLRSYHEAPLPSPPAEFIPPYTIAAKTERLQDVNREIAELERVEAMLDDPAFKAALLRFTGLDEDGDVAQASVSANATNPSVLTNDNQGLKPDVFEVLAEKCSAIKEQVECAAACVKRTSALASDMRREGAFLRELVSDMELPGPSQLTPHTLVSSLQILCTPTPPTVAGNSSVGL